MPRAILTSMVSQNVEEATRPPHGPALSESARAGLDVARAVAAIYVVLHHVVRGVDAPIALDLAFSFGQEAVIIFFLLSGFVIFANEADRSASPAGYYLRRIRRIYPGIVIAMALSTIMWAVGLLPGSQPTLGSALGTLFSVQDISFLKPGVAVDPYLGNSPLWSLSYEVFFYLLFPLVMFVWRKSERVARHAVGAVAVLGFLSYTILPNHLSLVTSYFLLWWLGAMAARAYLDNELRATSVSLEIFWMAVLTICAAAVVVVRGSQSVGIYPFLMVRHFGLALLLLLLLVSPVRSWLGRVSHLISVPAALVASISYGLYVFHYPLLVQPGLQDTLWVVPLSVALVLLAWFSDRALPRILPRAPRD